MQERSLQKAGVDPLARWVLFPPFISFFLLIATLVFHHRESSYPIPSVIWGIAIAAYICLCAISIYFISKKERRYNFGIACLAQGVLLSVMSLQAGVTFFSWIGLLLFLVGMFTAFFYATQHSASPQMDKLAAEAAQQAEVTLSSVDKVLAKFSLPLCYTDSNGIVSGATPTFLETVCLPAESVLGAEIDQILPVEDASVAFADGTWWISQIKEGARHYFYLMPTQDGRPAAPQQPKTPPGTMLYDPATGLYTDEYRKIRGPEEVARAQRYKRALSGVLLELIFDMPSSVALSNEQKAMLNKAFASKVRASLRAMDCGFWMDDQRRIQLLLPETPHAGAKTLVTRLMLLPQDVFEEDIRIALNPKVKAGMFFYNGTTKMEYGVFSATMEQAFAASKEGVPGITNSASAA